MSKALDTWFDFLKDRPLPALAPVGLRIQQQLNRLTSSQHDFAELLFFDPGLSIELLRTIARLPKAREPILTLSHAISMVGLKPLQMASLRMPSIERLPEVAWGGMRLCYSRAIHAAYYGRCWALHLGLPLPEEIGLAALIDECAEMALWANAPQQMLAINERRTKGYTTDDAAFQVLGTSLNRLSMALADYWLLPPLTLESLDRNVYEARPLCAQLASHFARTTDNGWINHKSALLTELCSDFLGMFEDDFLAFTHQLAAELARDAWFTGLPMMIHNLPMVPVDAQRLPNAAPTPETSKSDGLLGQKTLPAASKPTTTAPAAQPAAAPLAAAAIEPTLEQLDPHERIGAPVGPAKAAPAPPVAVAPTAPVKALDSRQNSPETRAFLHTGVMKLLIHLNKHLGLPRCLFARLHSDATLRVEAQMGTNQAPLKAFHYSTNNRLFDALLRKPLAVWINPGNRAQYQPLLPITSQGIWSDADIFLMSVFCHGLPLGIIYVDANGQNLDQASYNGFKLRVQRFAKLLEEHDLCPNITNPKTDTQ